MQKYVIIVAGGKGLRMGGAIPKQFLEVKGEPILMRTIDRFLAYDSSISVRLVLPESHFAYWREMCEKYQFSTPHTLVLGGETRFHSVLNGLNSIHPTERAVVAVHDGVRPFVSVETIDATFTTAAEKGVAVPVVHSVDSLRKVNEVGSESVDRSLFRLVQTPQTFQYDILKKSYEQTYRDTFTDDASVVEAAGFAIQLVEGNRENLKITTAYDMKIAEALVD